MKKGKKGQITVFIILGLLLLAAVVVYVSINQTEKEKGSAAIPKVEKVPIEFQPIQNYVENCLKLTAEEGLKLAMDHGGYIDPITSGINSNPTEPTSSNGVSLPGDFIIPYWYYLKSDNRCIKNCEFSSERPPLRRNEGPKSIEAQLDSYIKVKIKDCTRNFEAFKEDANVVENGVISITSSVLDSDVLFVMVYPLAVTKEGVTKEMNNFYVRIPVRLNDIYELATIMTNLEEKYRFLERDAVQLIVGFSGLDEDKLPPMSESRVQFGNEITWTKSKVKKDVESMLSSYIQLLRAQNTLNYQEYNFGDPYKDALYNLHMIIPFDQDYNHLAASFNYLPETPIYFDLNCDGETCKPLSVSQNFIALFGLQRYEFAYDISFPVMVEIFDPAAFDGKGYYFRYYLEANIRNNEVMKHDFWPLESIDMAAGSMMCDADKRNSGEIAINVKNKKGQNIDGADVAFSCADESCIIGATSNGLLKEKLPVCIGGFVTVMKEGYVSTSNLLSTVLDKKDSVDIVLDPLMEKPFKVKKKLIVRAGDNWIFTNNEVDIGRDEQAIVRITRVGSLGDEEHNFAAEYNGNQSIYGGEESFLTIAPGTYDISIQVINNQRFVIPPEKRKTVSNLFKKAKLTRSAVTLTSTSFSFPLVFER